MATYNVAEGGNVALPAIGFSDSAKIEVVVDFAKINPGVGTVAGDIIQALNVPAGKYTVISGYEVIEPSTVLADFDLGDAATPNGYIANASALALGKGVSAPITATVDASSVSTAEPVVFAGYSTGKYYPAADTINLRQNTVGNVTDGKIRVFAVLWDL